MSVEIKFNSTNLCTRLVEHYCICETSGELLLSFGQIE